ncbi:LOW QUALITY PROTEIN: TALPID3 protein-like [Haliotis rubra]|uniref:LOW QUALITY PROTEIN: TALPID3 protein-like n=1 Tax=Haliotis rubra TaxID=36100 RepID=UPI001EE59D1A|nr:LOW QUALITY PROTEIN: TALPID3 protein-like [Haliotis rubra]
MAIPLQKPRLEPGLRMPQPGPSSASTFVPPPVKPLVTAGTNVAMVTIPTEEVEPERSPELSKQVLPPVDIDSMSETSAQREVYIQSPQSPRRSQFDTSYHYRQQRSEDEEDEEEEEEDFDQSGVGIALPGHQPPPEPEPYGPEFPPPVARLPQSMKLESQITSDMLAEDLRQRDLMQNKAVQWIEQELMARVLTEVYPLRPADPIPHEPAPSVHTDESVDDESLLVMDTIGQTGLKLFVDAGQPVDNHLVNALVREVLSEQLTVMLGQRSQEDGLTARDGERRRQDGAEEDMARVEDEEDYSQQFQESPRQGRIRTPQPTPKTSPVMSPMRVISPPVTPTGSPVDDTRMFRESERRHFVSPPPPPPQVIPVTPVVPLTEPESEPETSVSLDISEELRQLRAIRESEDASFFPDSRHDVATPITTPPPELPHDEPVSPPPPSPPPPPQMVTVATSPPPQAQVQPTPEVPAEVTPPLPEETPDHGPPSTQADQNKPMETTWRRSLKTQQNVCYVHSATETSLLQAALQSAIAHRVPSVVHPAHSAIGQSPGMSDFSSSPVTSMTETINETVSEGQWLLSRSEGQAAPFPYEEMTRPRGSRRADVSTASTLRDTDDLDLDDTEVSKSEGEFLYRSVAAPDRDPVLQYVMSLQQQPALPAYPGFNYGQYDMPQGRAQNLLNTTGKSLGEISVGQVAPHRVTYIRASNDMEEEEEVEDGYRGAVQASPTKDGSPVKDTTMRVEDLKESRSQQRTTSPTSRSPPRRTDSGPVSAMPRSRSPTQRAKARKPPQATRFSDPLEMTEPPRASSKIISVRTSSEEFRESLDMDQMMNGTQTMSEQGTRTLTPDQMNTDHYMQSGYLSQTFSQSDGGMGSGRLTGTLGQSDGMGSGRLTGTFSQSGRERPPSLGSMRASSEVTGSRSGGISPDRLNSSGRSLGLTYSFESEVGDSISEFELRRLASSGPIKMSVKMPSTGHADDSEDLSEIDITDNM